MEYEIYNTDDELTHWGVRGMKWGIRRYQNKDGSLTPAGKKKYAKEMAKVKAETIRAKNQQKVDAKLKKLDDAKKNLRDIKKGKNLKEEAKKAEAAEDIETRKARILESRSAKQLYDNADLFTYNELSAAKLRLELERNIKNMEPATVDKGTAYVNKFVDASNKISDVASSGTKAYNNVAKVYNSLFGKKNGSTLPLIDDKVTSALDKYKDETEWIKAKNERKKAQDEGKEKAKSDLEKLRDETAWIDAQNKNREAKRASRAHDEKDVREAEKAQKAAEKATRESKDFREHNDPYTEPPKSGSSTFTDSSYRNSGGERTRTNPNDSYSIAVVNRSLSSVSRSSTTSRGEEATYQLLDRYGNDILEFD